MIQQKSKNFQLLKKTLRTFLDKAKRKENIIETELRFKNEKGNLLDSWRNDYLNSRIQWGLNHMRVESISDLSRCKLPGT